MTPAAAGGAKALSPLERLRIALRLCAMAALLAGCIPLHYLSRLILKRSAWPRRFLAGIAWLAGARITVRGERAGSGRLYLANHVSWLDIPALAGATGTAFVAHDGLASVPVLRWLCALNDTVFVARHDRRSIAVQIELIRAALADAGALAIFPEGTTSDGDDLLPFKSSLLSALDPLPPGMAVQPVLIDYGPESADIAWVGEEHGLDNFMRILARREPVMLTLDFLPPLDGAALANRKTIAAAAQASITEALRSAR